MIKMILTYIYLKIQIALSMSLQYASPFHNFNFPFNNDTDIVRCTIGFFRIRVLTEMQNKTTETERKLLFGRALFN